MELMTVINEESDRLNRLVGEAAEVAQLESHEFQLDLQSAPGCVRPFSARWKP